MPNDPHRVVLTGENPFIRLSPSDGAEESCVASFWRILFCPAMCCTTAVRRRMGSGESIPTTSP